MSVMMGYKCRGGTKRRSLSCSQRAWKMVAKNYFLAYKKVTVPFLSYVFEMGTLFSRRYIKWVPFQLGKKWLMKG